MEERKLDLFNETAVQNLSKKYEKTPGQIILNWEIHKGVIPIPGTSKPERMKENLEAANFKWKRMIMILWIIILNKEKNLDSVILIRFME